MSKCFYLWILLWNGNNSIFNMAAFAICKIFIYLLRKVCTTNICWKATYHRNNNRTKSKITTSLEFHHFVTLARCHSQQCQKVTVTVTWLDWRPTDVMWCIIKISTRSFFYFFPLFESCKRSRWQPKPIHSPDASVKMCQIITARQQFDRKKTSL